MKAKISSIIALVFLTLSGTVSAYEKGDFIVRLGATNVDPDASSSAISLAGTVLPDTSVDVDDDTQLGITATYMLSSRWGIELLASTPFEHDISESGVGVVNVGSSKQLPPTLVAQYYLANSNSAFQPYLGLGVNYTIFFDEEPSAAIANALGATKMELDDSVGIAFQIGADYNFNDRWGINVAVWNLDIDTDATISTAAGNVTVDVEVDPWVYMLGMKYKF